MYPAFLEISNSFFPCGTTIQRTVPVGNDYEIECVRVLNAFSVATNIKQTNRLAIRFGGDVMADNG